MNPLRQSPRFAVSSRCSPLLNVDGLARAASGVPIDGVDLDLTVRSMVRRLVGSDSAPDLNGVMSVWVSPTSASVDRVRWSDWYPRAGLVVVDEEKGKSPNGKVQLDGAIRVRERTPASARVALAVRPRNPDGGRAHLAHLSFLRNLAEEWDLDLALDLSGPVDWLWEAEAAMFRLSPRLRLLRVTCPLPAMDTHIRSRLTQRTIAAAVDTAYDGLIAVVVPLPFWRWRDVAGLERSARIAVERLSDRFGIVPVRDRRQERQRSSAS